MTKHRLSPVRQENLHKVTALEDGSHGLPANYPIPPGVLANFIQQMYGQVVLPSSPNYDEARQEFNPAFPRYPQIIAFCICLSDVRECLELARKYSLHAVARSGRHSLAGYSNCDGMVIDTSQINSMVIDHAAMTATVGAGISFERFNAHLESYGLHCPGGGCPTVCVAGYMQGGGYGFTSREFGIHSDNVLAIKMVLADGRVVTANADQNADLFWAVRGGTGNQFGILIEVKYRIYEMGLVWGIRLEWLTRTHLAEAAQALQTIQNDFIRSKDKNNLGFQTVLAHSPGTSDGLRVNFAGIYNGHEKELDQLLQPLTSIPGCQVTVRMQGRYSRVDETLLNNIPPIPGPTVRGLSRCIYLEKDLAQADWEAIIKYVQTAPNEWAIVDMEGYGGKINEVSPGESAFMHRNVTMDMFCDVFWAADAPESDRQRNEKWLNDFMAFMAGYGNGHSFQNYPNRDQEDWRWAYFGPYYPTLVWVKNKFDPTNFFHYQQSITPDPDCSHEKDYKPVLFDDPNIAYDEV